MIEIARSSQFFLDALEYFLYGRFKEARNRTILPFDADDPHLPEYCNSFTTRSSQLSFA